MIVAAELGAALRITSGPAIERAGDLVAILTSLGPGEVLFIDEIHRIARPAEELLYSAMEDFRVDVVLGKGPGATAIPLDVAPFTLVGATTRAGLLTGPMHDRFGFVGHLDFYDQSELEQVLARSAALLGISLTPDGAAEVASRSRGTPRIANRLLRRVRDYAEVRAAGVVTRPVAEAALAVFDVDKRGSTAWTAPSSLHWSALSAEVRSGSRLWPLPSARRRRPWKTWSSPTCYAPGSLPAPPEVGWPLRPPSNTSGLRRRCPGTATRSGTGEAAPGSAVRGQWPTLFN